MDSLKLIFLALLSILSVSEVKATYYRYSISYYEVIPLSDTVAFTPKKSDAIPNKGTGYVKHNALITQEGRVLGHVGGIYFYHGQDVIEDIVTITFSKDMRGIWCASSINLRGLWYMTPDGEADLNNQELAIVGGQGHFRGATGSVYYQRVQSQPQTVFFVTCDIYIPDFLFYGKAIEVDLDQQFKPDSKPQFLHGHGDLMIKGMIATA
ncbi:protein MpDIR58 [Marchantia polymorpha subsp. ruderalis]|nr:hypothetical protein MARPO_0211s0002 [Marchantia polymorpha]PTQ27242.1 hypothetical protein MARPO_0211s0002 [Marchantia polymorpha]BBN00961.1 hypothetical protein Mp_2g03460 [Marchantia polymorpha subsp. ruderalis]BBN00962.1 hypothetical protein Mp_2g03460 [Marchantia polymorpha subsp. ruderalis]|eukprot:PTQ27241.1 hypothetical protein MARPO_0211s0002 [Marchantia polymorpha]